MADSLGQSNRVARKPKKRRSRSLNVEPLEPRRVLCSASIVDLGVTGVGASQATINGEITDIGADVPNVTIYWGDESGGVTPANWDSAVNLGGVTGNFNANLSGLGSQSTYYYRAFAENSCGGEWASAVGAFITPSSGLSDAVSFNDYDGSAHPNTTNYAPNGASSGSLLDINSGQPTGVTLTTLGVGISFAGSQSQPAQDTDAADIFTSFVDLNNGGLEVAGNDSYTYRFSGMDAGKLYEFAGTAVRGNNAYTNRWTRITLEGADSFSSTHSSGVGVITAGLPANEVVIWFGANQNPDQGFVARWSEIDPGSDGIIDIVAEQYTGAVPTSVDSGGVADGSKGYAPSVVRLTESSSGLAVVDVDPSPAEVFATAPATATLDFGLPVNAATVSAADLTVDGAAAIGVTIVDADTIRWTLPAGIAAGEHEIDLAANVLAATTGEDFVGFTSPFTVAALPTLVNTTATGVSSSAATANVNLVFAGFDSPDVSIYWGDSDGGTNPANWGSVIDLGKNDAGAVSGALAGLSPTTTYYYRALASNSAGDFWAPTTASFTTATPGLPGVSVAAPTSISPFSAEIPIVVAAGNDTTTATVFYGPTDGGTNAANWGASVQLGAVDGNVDAVLSGLNPETTYFYAARATNSVGTVWDSRGTSFATTAVPSIVINEIGSGESDTLETRTRINTTVSYSGQPSTPDWIELYNPGDTAIDLAGFHLTDDSGNDDKWTFPSGSVIPAGGYLVVYASGENLFNPNLDQTGRYHTNFKLSASGEYLGLYGDDGDVIHEYAPEFSRIYEGYTVGLDADGEEVAFSVSTPDAANNLGSIVQGFVADTKFSVDRGFYDASFALEITSATPGATISYTTNGSEPTLTNGTRITAPNGSTAPAASLTISGTTVVRARAYLGGWVATDIDTHSYFFIDDVLQQPSNPSGFPNSWGGAPSADYGLDPQIVNDASYTQDLIDGLTEIATLSVTSSVANIFGSGGLYSNTNNSNLEVVASAELILADGTQGFQIDAGLKLQGGASRNPGNSPKHALSLRFRDSIDDGKLDYDVFGSDVTSFDSLHLRSRYNNSWIHWSQSQRSRGTLIRDEWIRDTQLDMGNEDAGQGRFVHLYLNGLYWGVYSVEERPDAAHYAAYYGGHEGDYDALNGGSPIDGNLTSYNAMKATVATRNWENIQQVLDVDRFIDYLIVQQFGRNNDLKDNGNWRAAGGGPNNAPWVFYAWDSERVLEGVGEDAPSINDPTSSLVNNLERIDEYKIRFADRVQELFFNDGALTPAKNTERWNERVAELENAIVAESARWGDYRRDVDRRNCGCDLYDRDDYWLPAVNSVANSYFPARTNQVLNDYRNVGLFPGVAAPPTNIDFVSQHGGPVAVGAGLTFNSTGNVYYTLDGMDPRAEGGAAVGTLYRNGQTPPIVLTESTTVKARVLSGTTWSALTNVDFVVVPVADSIAVTEINYHPHDSTAAEMAVDASLQGDDFEFIEITNTHPSVTVNVLGMEFVNGVTFTMPDVSLAPGERAVVVEDVAAFQLRYGNSVTILGQWSGGLSNSGESLELVDALGNLMLDVEYGDGDEWPDSADGFGASLVWSGEFTGNPDRGDKHYNWLGSREFGGTPGAAPTARAAVVINEVLTNSDGVTNLDAIELHNTGATAVNIGGWYLSDSGSSPLKYQIPGGTILEAGGYLVFDETQFNPNPNFPSANQFGLNSSTGDDVWLTVSDGSGGISQFVDDVHFAATFTGETLGRDADGSGRLLPTITNSLGCENHPTNVSEVVISEINYSPADDLEFIEITNLTNTLKDLTEWQVRGGVEFDFPSGLILGAHASVVVTSFNPFLAANTELFASFISTYNIFPSVIVVGPYSGKLSNSGEPLRLLAPGPPISPALIPHVLVDEVVYDDAAPWDPAADVAGSSLQRIAGIFPGNEASSWVAAAPTAGVTDFEVNAPGDLTGDGIFTATDIDLLRGAIRRGSGATSLDLNSDGSVDDQDVTYLVETIIGTTFGDANLDGAVNTADFDLWNAHRFEDCAPSWGGGDFNGDGIADVSDFNIWNTVRTSQLATAVGVDDSADGSLDSSLTFDWRNGSNAQDVNGDGIISPLDALLVINELNSRSYTDEGGLFLRPRANNDSFLDVSGDGSLSPLDALAVINRLNGAEVDVAFQSIWEIGDDEDET